LPAPNSYIIDLRLAFQRGVRRSGAGADGKIGGMMQRQANLPVTDYVCFMA